MRTIRRSCGKQGHSGHRLQNPDTYLSGNPTANRRQDITHRTIGKGINTDFYEKEYIRTRRGASLLFACRQTLQRQIKTSRQSGVFFISSTRSAQHGVADMKCLTCNNQQRAALIYTTLFPPQTFALIKFIRKFAEPENIICHIDKYL